MEQVEINKEAKLSEHFSLGELTKTNVKGISNEPPHAAVLNLKNLCENWLEPLRQAQGLIIINSGYRSESVNKAIGGVKGSNHLTGCAVDIRVTGIEQAIRYAATLLDIADGGKDFDELLIERSPKGTYWVHFAVRPKENRRKVRFLPLTQRRGIMSRSCLEGTASPS